MSLHRTTVNLAAYAAIFCVSGCGAPAGPSGGGGGASEPDPVSASLVPGSYAGDVESTTQLFVDGVEQNEPIRATVRIRETIDSSGMPILSSGEPIRTDDVIVFAEAGDNRLLGTVSSVVPQENGLILSYDIDGEVGGIPVSGTGQTSYETQDDGSLMFDLSLDFAGVDAEGRVISQTEQRTGILAPTSG